MSTWSLLPILLCIFFSLFFSSFLPVLKSSIHCSCVCPNLHSLLGLTTLIVVLSCCSLICFHLESLPCPQTSDFILGTWLCLSFHSVFDTPLLIISDWLREESQKQRHNIHAFLLAPFYMLIIVSMVILLSMISNNYHDTLLILIFLVLYFCIVPP